MSSSDPRNRALTIRQWFKSRKSLMSSTGISELIFGLPPLLSPKGFLGHQGNNIETPHGRSINTYFPVELLRGIFLYCIEVNQIRAGDLASVCYYWMSIITTMPRLWSTLRVGAWTKRERVATWLQRAYPLKIVIDAERDDQRPSKTPPFVALQDALASSHKWHGLTISSFLPENLVSQLDFQAARPMNGLITLCVVAGCVHSPYFTRLLDLVPSSDASLSELRLYAAFAGAYFIQPHFFSVLQNLTVLIVNGREIHEPFPLLPDFAQLQIFEADHLLLPWYEPNANLPLLHTLQKLRLRASSIQWMAGKEFLHLVECAILLPHHWEAVQQHRVKLPSCSKFAYHGYPMTTVQCFHLPQMKALELRSHDCKQQRVYQELYHLCTLGASISKLTTLHLTLQCSERVFIKVLEYMGTLQELVLSIAYPSSSWTAFLKSLVAKPSTDNWSKWNRYDEKHDWGELSSSQTWHAALLPFLRYLGIQSPKGFSYSQCLHNLPLLRLVAWTRAHLSPPLEHLKLWEGRGTTDDIAIDYISTGYLDKHLGASREEYDWKIIRGMVTQSLCIDNDDTPLFKQLHSTVLFRQLQILEIKHLHDVEVHIFPFLEQIKEIELHHCVSACSPGADLPLIHTLQRLQLNHSTFSWMLGRTFTTLKECNLYDPKDAFEDLSRRKGLQVDIPTCTALRWDHTSVIFLPFFCCPTLQILQWEPLGDEFSLDETVHTSLYCFSLNSSALQQLVVTIDHRLGLDSLIQFVFRDAQAQGIWKDIKSVELYVKSYLFNSKTQLFTQMVGHQRHYENDWKKFIVSRDEYKVCLRASR